MKKIGEIKGVPVVEGNINEVTKNQIHYKEDSGSIQLSKRGNDNKLNSITGSSSDGSSSKYAPRYFSIDWDKCSNSWKYILSDSYKIEGISYYLVIGFSATTKCCINGDYLISANNGSSEEETIAFSYIPLIVPNYAQEIFGTQYQMPFNINDLIECINIVIKDVLNLDIEPISMEGITEITEEEYYKID